MRPLLAALSVVVAVAVGSAAAQPIGGPAATLTISDGTTTERLSDRIDGPAIVHLWATWCPPCLEELPKLDAFLDANRTFAPVVVVVSVDTAPVERVATFLRDIDVGLPPFKIVSGNAGEAFGVTSYPSTVFLGPDGAVLSVEAGALDWSAPGMLDALRAKLR